MWVSRGRRKLIRIPILISGTSVLSEEKPTGSFIPGFSEKIYDVSAVAPFVGHPPDGCAFVRQDNKVEDIRGLGPKQPHRSIDLQ